ncbi:ABC transporter substrate-binding protein [Candidatus Xianfuyuplasma coldseepsis]|uniref:Dockerin domain-containing protein n=1 Tax=Candidatus Xianfuyuplasma coldseepsis TaxID=2782163 RepID=A0A7L7KTN7_9MOLU|nr:ABC transporter substrate-binding protein [Xianfuyuplasma coldseepsis]QMS85148.1 hypothetical protein G4Z02_05110 [Xianfuyuplasma coldseepsis]
MLKKSVAVVMLLVVGFVSFVTLRDIAAEGNGLMITSTELEYITPDSDFSIDIVADNAVDLVGFQTKLLYDTSKFTLVSVEDSSSLGNPMTINDTIPGELVLNYVDVLQPLNGSQVLFTVTFHASSTILYEDVDVVTEDPAYMHQFITIDELYNVIPVDVVTFNFDQVKRGYIGDANLDGTVNITDAAIMQLYIAELTSLETWEAYFADVNQDGFVSVIDVAKVQLYVAGIISTLEPDGQVNITYNYANGVYDLTQIDTEDKAILFAAAERYLLDTMSGGVPLYTSASRVMFSDRTALFSPEYNGVLQFGEEYSSLTADDSTVYMYDAVYGNPGEYTWRDHFSYYPTEYNPYIVDDSASMDIIELFTGKLYKFYFGNDVSNFEINPDLAANNPVAVDPQIINGKVYATTWDIPLRTDLVWNYYPTFDTSLLPAGHDVLDANDYIWTWQTALDNQWFRATAGGGDFITNGIKNAQEYIDGTKTWTDVGLKAIDNNTIRLEFDFEKSMFDIKYMTTNQGWSPINQELYEYLGENTYGSSLENVAYSGPYTVDERTQGQFLFFAKNPLYAHEELYHFTGIQYRYIEADDQVFEEFLAGRLDTARVPSTRVNDFVNDPRISVVPGTTTWRLMINAFGTEENRDAYIAQYPNTGINNEFIPEPLLQYVDMRKALYYGIDRYQLAVTDALTYLPAYALFTDYYFIDAEGGISVRGSVAGQAILDDFGMGTYGYDAMMAYDYFIAAVNQGISDGYYTPGTPEAYTQIVLELRYASSGNTTAQAAATSLKQQYESLFVDDTNYIQVIIDVHDTEFPSNYYDYMMVANSDLGIGGISGSLIDAPGFLEVYQDDNVSGFTLNWGMDTHTPNIEVSYHNVDGTLVHEIWSFNALSQALQRRVYVRDGIIQYVFDSTTELIDAYMDMEGMVVATRSDGTNIAQYVLGDTLANLQVANGLDGLYAEIIVSDNGETFLMVVQELNGEYRVYDAGIYPLFTDAESAIQAHSGYPLGSVDGLLADDAAIAGNAYLSSMGYSTLAEIAVNTGAPIDQMEVYAVTWAGNYTGSDAYVVLHIDGYYLGWKWL